MSATLEDRPPTVDPVAAERWQRDRGAAPWLHEEVGRRMAERLDWIKLKPTAWTDWDAVRGGLAAHALVAGRYPKAQVWLDGAGSEATVRAAMQALMPPWWSPRRWKAALPRGGPTPDGAVQMLWANMALHMSATPQALIARWHRALTTDGFLMFSCLGPDTLRELRSVYGALGWPPPSHEFTDMHDWGDMLVHAGFAEPVMDMERIVLTYETPQALLRELRGLGRNLHPQRFPALRGRGWLRRAEAALAERLAGPDGRLAITFEIIYGHAFRPAPRVPLAAQSAISLGDMRGMLQGRRTPGPAPR